MILLYIHKIILNYKKNTQEKFINLEIKSESEKFTKLKKLTNLPKKQYFEGDKFFFKNEVCEIILKLSITLQNGFIKEFGKCIIKKNLFHSLDNKGKFFVLNFRDKFYANKKIYLSLFNFEKKNKESNDLKNNYKKYKNKEDFMTKNKIFDHDLKNLKNKKKETIIKNIINNQESKNAEIINNNINLKIYNDNRNLKIPQNYKKRDFKEIDKSYQCFDCDDLIKINRKLFKKKILIEKLISTFENRKKPNLFIFDLPLFIFQKKIEKEIKFIEKKNLIKKKFDFDFKFLKEKICKEKIKLKKIKIENNYLFFNKKKRKKKYENKKNYLYINEKSNKKDSKIKLKLEEKIKENNRLRKRIKVLLKKNIIETKNKIINNLILDKEQNPKKEFISKIKIHRNNEIEDNHFDKINKYDKKKNLIKYKSNNKNDLNKNIENQNKKFKILKNIDIINQTHKKVNNKFSINNKNIKKISKFNFISYLILRKYKNNHKKIEKIKNYFFINEKLKTKKRNIETQTKIEKHLLDKIILAKKIFKNEIHQLEMKNFLFKKRFLEDKIKNLKTNIVELENIIKKNKLENF